jgi:DedD protein
MNANDGRRNKGWVSTLVALIALVVVGFLCGALAGFLWEEPGLVLAHFTGKTEPVEFSEPSAVGSPPPGYAENSEVAPDSPAKLVEAEPPPAAPAVADEPPARDEAADEIAPAKPPAPPAAKPVEKKPPVIAPAKPAPAKTAPAKIASVAPAAAGRFWVQVGAFADRASADTLVARLKGHGYTTYVKVDGEGSLKRFRVRVGPVNGRPRAEELVAKLKGEKIAGWIVDESKG